MAGRKRIAALALGLLVLSAVAWAATAAGTVQQPQAQSKMMSQRLLDINAWRIYCTNYGPFVNPTQGGSGGFWGGTGYNYIYGAGVWIAGTNSSGARAVACGYNPNSGQSEMGPVNPRTEDWNGWLSDPASRVYLSTEPGDVLDWPRLDADGKKLIKSRQDSYCKYSDMNPQYTWSGESRLNVVIEQVTYAWNYADNNDIVFFFFNVKNTNNYDLSNCYIGPGIDCDIGNESGTSANDRTTFDYQRNLGMQFQATEEPGWPRTGVVGFRFFQGPRNNTGEVVNIVDDQYPHSIQPDSMLGMTCFTIFTISIDPKTDEERYLAMEGVDWLSGTLDAYDQFGAESAGDKRFIQGSGPFILKARGSGSPDTITTLCVGTMAAWDTTALKIASDVAQEIFNNDFELSNPPMAPQLTVVAGDKHIRITWNTLAEDSADAYYYKIPDTTAWYTYYKGGWQYLTDKHLVDSFEIKTGTTTTVKIAKGDPNPAGGTDTVASRFNQKSMYKAYDFQGYILYRARTLAELMDPNKRVALGGRFQNQDTTYSAATCSYSGGGGYMFDKKDGVQIVPNFTTAYHLTPSGSVQLGVWDTIGSDRGLIYTFVDSNVVNGLGYYYGLVAYDFQSNAYYTHKCPTFLMTNPTENAVYAVAHTENADWKPAAVRYSNLGGADERSGGSTDFNYLLEVASPGLVKTDSFRLVWKTEKWQRTTGGSTYYLPNYRAFLYHGGTLIDSTNLKTNIQIDKTGTYYQEPSGTIDDQLYFGGVVFKPWVEWKKADCVIDSLVILEGNGSRTYPPDSVTTALQASIFDAKNCLWQWRGSDFEIRWQEDTLRVSGVLRNILRAQVWDLTNNIEVPLDTLTKKSMTTSGWAFNPADAVGRSFCDSTLTGASSAAGIGMHICGLSVYFNKAGNVIRRIGTLWANRPDNGDVWRIYTSGPRPPVDGNITTFYTEPTGQVGALSENLLDKVKVVPNPYLVRANWDVSKNYPNIYFTHLPAKCTIRIYTLGGDLVKVIQHDANYVDNDGTERWDLLTTYNRRIASGIYIYQIDAPGIGTKLDKFAVIK